MAFVTKEWKDRLVEFAGRRLLKNVATGDEATFDVSRAEGTVSQAGHAFSAATMNDLEERIKDGFDEVNSNLTADGTPFRFGKDSDGKYGYIITGEDGADTVIPFKSSVEIGEVTIKSFIIGNYFQPSISRSFIASDDCILIAFIRGTVSRTFTINGVNELSNMNSISSPYDGDGKGNWYYQSSYYMIRKLYKGDTVYGQIISHSGNQIERTSCLIFITVKC